MKETLTFCLGLAFAALVVYVAVIASAYGFAEILRVLP
jgi:hypothetical protein